MESLCSHWCKALGRDYPVPCDVCGAGPCREASPPGYKLPKDMRAPAKPVIAFCPKCQQETFEVRVEDSGSHPDEWGTNHWYRGMGRCRSCGHAGEHSDSSH